MHNRPLLLNPSVRNYPWGKLGSNSYLARYCKQLDEGQPHAELWIGAHPKSPSGIVGEAANLAELISQFKVSLLGQEIAEQYASLPFLFKVLSIGKPLSIQAHPDKKLAKLLHAQEQLLYPDPNHKPELAVALTKTELLHGFRPANQLQNLTDEVPELKELISEPDVSRKDLAAQIFCKLLQTPQSTIEQKSISLFSRLKNKANRTLEERWILSLEEEYPKGDFGLFCFFLLNLVTLEPGEGIFTAPNVCHAYLGGDILECMANSDNVVRCGLTNKACDKDTLLKMLQSAKQASPPHCEIREIEHCKSYLTPANEFRLDIYKANNSTHQLKTASPKIALVLKGHGKMSWKTLEGQAEELPLTIGNSFFLPASLTQVVFELEEGEVAVCSCP